MLVHEVQGRIDALEREKDKLIEEKNKYQIDEDKLPKENSRAEK